MKKNEIISIITLCVVIFSLTGCGNTEVKENNSNTPIGLKAITGKIYQAEKNDNGDIVIDKDNITENVSYYSYEYQDVIIGLLAVKDENGIIHVVVNTCQSCGGSPYAYFVQIGNKIQCQNCGNSFLITELDNLVADGCNPIGIEDIEEKDDKLIINHEEIEQYKSKFENWQGPKK